MIRSQGDAANSSIVHEFVRMVNEKDVDILDGLLSEDFVNHNPYTENGREAQKVLWSYWFSACPDLEATVYDAFATGDRVAGRLAFRGTHTGEFLGAQPTGQRLEMTTVDIWRVEGGVFVEHWDEINSLELFRQLGLVSD
jgi:predicted ester cyclase